MGDARAASTLEHVHAALRAKADAVTDASLRTMYLYRIAAHSEIITAWDRRGASANET
jgi:hypothetical protein